MNKTTTEGPNKDSNIDYSNPPILRANQQLADEVELLGKYISSLEDRLDAVLYSGPTEAPGEILETKAEDPSGSPLGAFIQKQTGMVRSSRLRIMSLVERLEV